MLLEIEPYSDEWKAYRQGRVSGTDVPVLCGESRFGKTPLTIWSRITGKVAPKEPTGAHLDWGRNTEEANRRWFSHEANVRTFGAQGFHRDDEFDWLCYTPDGFFARPTDSSHLREFTGVWDGKAPTPWTPDDWTEGVPRFYQVQLHAGMRVCKKDEAAASALIHPQLLWAFVPKSEAFIEAMMDTLMRFWDFNVQRDIPPDPTASDADKKVLGELHRPVSRLSIVLSPIVAERARLLVGPDGLVAQHKRRQEEIDAIKNEIRAELVASNAERGEDPLGDFAFSYKMKAGFAVPARFQEPTPELRQVKA